MEPSPPRTKNPSPILPKKADLSPTQLHFLNHNFLTQEHLLARAPLLVTDLTNHCSLIEADISKLRQRLVKLVVSWIFRSFTAKSSLADLNREIHSLCLRTSPRQGAVGPRSLEEELPRIVKQVRRIESIRKYVDTALKLEALVGDLEDVVFCFWGRQLGKMSSVKGLTSQLSLDFGIKQKRFSSAIEVLNVIEGVLVDAMNFQPHWHCLFKSVESRVDKALAAVRSQLLSDHRALLASLGWPPKFLASKVCGGETIDLPNPLALMEGDKRNYYSQSFLALCALQHLQTRRENRQHDILEQRQPVMTLWSIEELVSPIASRMECHFSKWTKQPEFMFALAFRIASNFLVGVDNVLQPLIDRARLVGYSAKEAWLSAMVQMLSGYLAKEVFPNLAKRYKEKHMKSEAMSSWLYLIDCIIGFDKQMQSLVSSESHFFLFEYDRSQDLRGGLSLLEIFCDRPDWLKLWAKVELKDAWNKLKPELKDEKTWLSYKSYGADFCISTESEQYKLTGREVHKAPLIAESIIKVAWEMVERCQTLPSILLRAQFIRSTTAKLLWYFFDLLAWRSKNAQFASDNNDDALVKISGSINAARYVESKLHEWTDDIDFLEMRIAEMHYDIGLNFDGLNNSCFFHEEIKSLVELETNLLMEIISVLLHRFEALSWDYLHDTRHFGQVQADFTLNGVLATIDGTLSIDFVQALDAMRSHLQLLKSTLNPKDFLDLWRSVAEGLDHFISSSIFASDIRFSNAGISQLRDDAQALFLVFKSFCARPESFFPCIRETLMLLQMTKEEVKQMQVVLSNGTSCLRPCGILHLSLEQVDKVLRNIIFGP